MGSSKTWRLCEELTIVQAALLMAGADPSDYNEVFVFYNPDEMPEGFEGAKTAISGALLNGKIKGHLSPEYDVDENGRRTTDRDGTVHLQDSKIEVASLKNWLQDGGFTTGFFFPENSETPDYLDRNHPRYAHKLAAAVEAWMATADYGPESGGTPKQRLVKWLSENATKYGLRDNDGKLNDTGVDEIAKVANWKPGGGAPNTPGAK